MTKRKHLSDEAILAYFRESYPQKYDHEFVPDYPRHTNTSAFVEISLGMVDAAATYHGNSRKKIEDHYRGRMSLAEAIVHYRLLPTALKGTYRPEDVPLPKWSQIDIDKLDEADNKEMAKLYGNLPRFDPSVDYGRNGGRTELQRQRSSNSQKERWAKVKARDDWTDKKKKMQTAVAKARLGLNGAVRAKAGKGRWEKLKSQGDWPDRKAKLVMSLQKALPKKVEMGLVKAAPEATTLQASDFSAA